MTDCAEIEWLRAIFSVTRGSGTCVSPGLFVVTKSDLDPNNRKQHLSQCSPYRSENREFFKLRNNQDNRKVIH